MGVDVSVNIYVNDYTSLNAYYYSLIHSFFHTHSFCEVLRIVNGCNALAPWFHSHFIVYSPSHLVCKVCMMCVYVRHSLIFITNIAFLRTLTPNISTYIYIYVFLCIHVSVGVFTRIANGLLTYWCLLAFVIPLDHHFVCIFIHLYIYIVIFHTMVCIWLYTCLDVSIWSYMYMIT
jgi:hypothetical protein